MINQLYGRNDMMEEAVERKVFTYDVLIREEKELGTRIYTPLYVIPLVTYPFGLGTNSWQHIYL